MHISKPGSYQHQKHSPTHQPNSLLVHSIKMEEAGLGKLCPSFLPSVHKLWMVAKHRTGWGAGRQWGAEIFRIRLFTLEEISLSRPTSSFFKAQRW